ncbi:MAG TPA: choloylglycine hydrolase [Lachnospiraceae bacterium]|nr:choloylglycine hydrolase [Lachnospiraceae bacterium]
MCTAATYKTKDHYFGRNLDLEYSYDETVTVTPRNYPFRFRKVNDLMQHYAMVGMAYVVEDYPLYYDATNEKGLSMAGLYFPGNAHYKPEVRGMDNVATFELIPWVLGQCGNISEVRVLLEHINIWNENFSRELPAMPLHWMVSDREETIVLEAVSDGLKIYDNPVGVLTNNPPFDFQMFHLSNYMNVSAGQAENRFSKKIDLKACSKGMGGLGLPGDLSSASRFVKAAFTRLNSVSGDSESESISQFFHILGSVDQQRGCVRLENQLYEITVYSSCCNTDKGIYYYTTYENRQISGVDMYRENLDGRQLICYPLIQNQQIYMQN